MGTGRDEGIGRDRVVPRGVCGSTVLFGSLGGRKESRFQVYRREVYPEETGVVTFIEGQGRHKG